MSAKAILRSSCLFGLVLSFALRVSAQAPPAPPPPGAPPEDDVSVVLEGAVQAKLRLAFPAAERPGTLSPEVTAAADELEQTLRDDLEETRVFEIQGPWALQVLKLTGDPARDILEYRSLGNQILLLATLSQDGSRVVFEGRVIDLNNGESVLGKRYRGTAPAARRIAHTFADEVLRYLTGLRGIAQTSLAFVSNRSGYKEIYLMDYDGRNQRQLTSHRSISMAPDWQVGNGGLVYLSFVAGQPGIYYADVATGLKRPVVVDAEQNISPAMSPDGKQVAFARSVGGNTDVYVTDIGGKNLRRLTSTPSIDTNPSWSPSGRELAFTSSRTGQPQIYVMDGNGDNVRRVTFDGDYNDGAVWHPEEPRIAYASRRGGVFQIAITDLATGETYTLTSGAENHETPCFSPDGRRIAFSQRRGRSTQIFVMDSDGSHVKQLTQDGDNSSPAWSFFVPEGRN